MPIAKTFTSSIVACLLAIFVSWSSTCTAAEPSDFLTHGNLHPVFRASNPPGMVGSARLMGQGPVVGYYQPVAITGPGSAHFALPAKGRMTASKPRLEAGFLIGSVYRFQITQIPGAIGVELFPTIEVIDRTYPPQHLATQYPIEVQLDEEDFLAAIDGQMVTRVIYLEDPQTAIPSVQTASTNRPFEVSEFQDPLAVADHYGRPVAIVRIGSLKPPSAAALLPEFFFDYPTWAPFPNTPSNHVPSEFEEQP